MGAGFCDFPYKPRDTFPRRGLAIPSTLMKERRNWKAIWRMTRLRILPLQILKILRRCRVIDC